MIESTTERRDENLPKDHRFKPVKSIFVGIFIGLYITLSICMLKTSTRLEFSK